MNSDGQRLLDIDVLARVDRRYRLNCMPVVGRSDADGINVFLVQEFAKILVQLRLLAKTLAHFRDLVGLQPPGLDLRLIPQQEGLVDVAQRGDFHVVVGHEALHQLRAAISEPDKSDPDPVVGAF